MYGISIKGGIIATVGKGESDPIGGIIATVTSTQLAVTVALLPLSTVCKMPLEFKA